MTDWLPRARRDDLLIESVDEELLLYDLRSQRAHFLSASAAGIWHASDGATPVAELALALVDGGETAHREALACRILRELLEHDLLEDQTDVAPQLLSRREMIEHVAIPLAMLPFVVSLSAPTAAMAQSCPPMSPQGFQGFAGPEGGCDCGPQGSNSPQGFEAFETATSGPQGFQGIAGPQGNCFTVEGSQGPQTPVGPVEIVDPCQGPQGFQGPQGPSSSCPI